MHSKLVLLCVLVFSLEFVCCQYSSAICYSPDVFNFEDDGVNVYGKIVLQSTVPVFSIIIRLDYTIAVPLYDNYKGYIEALAPDGNSLVQKYNRGEPVAYRVHFPVTSPLPKLTALTVNGNIICKGPGDIPGPSSVVSALSLDHSSFLQQQSRPEPEPLPQPQPPPQQHRPELLPTNRPEENPNTPIECGTIEGGNDNVPLIYNGDSYERGELPWLVVLYRREKDALKLICGGTLVSNRHIITAAQCLQSSSKRTSIKDIVVKVGVHDLDDWSDDIIQTRRVISGHIHPEFKATTSNNNIMVMTLNKPVEFNTFIRPACIWNRDTDQSRIVNNTGVVGGWGAQDPEDGGRLSEPTRVRIPIVSTDICRASNPIFRKITSETTFCAGKRDGSGPCTGDGGSGLYLLEDDKWTLRGLVSVIQQTENEESTCNLSEYIVFTDVAQHWLWIRSILAISIV